ncbi:uncharacterized protein LOC115033005 [Acyrthosiphon pisum]|uniref:MD-2-related lipid-recognition domain-containing protein n=1 Tax=Acyrthosiphon pisum TaxID=7029 RepID=A0A8R2JR83_ACYPI|nr:uncharacterized protein LOC115033005 [Acyrthosiphon pisum]
MNFFSVILLTLLLFLSSLISYIGSRNLNILSVLPLGPYKLNFKQVRSCDSSKSYKIQHNFYLSFNQISNATEIRGTTISIVPFDDTLFMEANVALRDKDGNWKDNTYMHKSPKACSSFRNLMGAEWTTVINGLGIKNATCPIPPGNYTGTGVDTSLFSNTNLPKTFVYGTYRLRYYYTRNNEVYTCLIYVFEIKPL